MELRVTSSTFQFNIQCQYTILVNTFGTLKGLDPYFWSQKTQTLSLTRDPPESQFLIPNPTRIINLIQFDRLFSTDWGSGG